MLWCLLRKTEKECPCIQFTFFNATNGKNEDISFYNYYDHLKNFGFQCENDMLDYKFSINLSKDEKKLIKKWLWANMLAAKYVLMSLELEYGYNQYKKTILFDWFSL